MFRALISVPIDADNIVDALRIAFTHADTLRHPDSADVIAGHVEVAGPEEWVLGIQTAIRKNMAPVADATDDIYVSI